MDGTETTTLWFPPPAQPTRRGRTWLRLLLVFFFLAMITMALLGLGIVVWFESDMIMPGVSVSGIDLGGLSTIEAADAVEEQWQGRTLSLATGDNIIMAPPADLGFSLDTAATVEQAYQQGRSFSSLEDLLLSGRLPEQQMIWRFDPGEAEIYLQELAPEAAVAAVDAGVKVTAGRAEATPSVTGRLLDVDATLNTLISNPAQVLNDGQLELVMTPVQPQVTDASAAAAAANQMLSTTINLTIFDPISDDESARSLAPDMWGAWLSVEFESADGKQFHWKIDETGLQAFLAQVSAGLGEGRYLNVSEVAGSVATAINQQNQEVAVRVFHSDRQHTVQSGETLTSIGYRYGIPYPWLLQANPGVGDGLFVGQSITIPSPDNLLPLPVVAGKRIVVSITQQRAWVYQDSALKWEWPVSTGIDSSPTWPGIFQIQSHESNAYASNWDLWMPNFLGVYRPVPDSDFMNGFHGFPTRSGTNLLWTGDLGRKVTYGCILLSSENASILYDWAEEGVIVEIQP